MSIVRWLTFKPSAARAAEAEANIRRAIREREAAMADLPEMFPRKGPTEEARVYAYALDLIRRVGPGEASRIADLFVRNVQMLSRGGQ